MDECLEHDWEHSLDFTPESGVMPVHCAKCGEVGYYFETKEKVND